MPSMIDQARDAGFSDDEIVGWASGQIPTWKQAGFSDDEIGSFVTGIKRPGKVPPSLVSRLMSTAADVGELQYPGPSRLGGVAAEGFRRGFGTEPLGVPVEDREKLQAMGLYAEPGKFQPLRLLNQGIIEPSYLAAQTLFRTVNGVLGAVGTVGGEVAAQVAGLEGGRKEQAREEATQFVNIAALLAGAHTPMAHEGGVLPNGRVADNIVGHLPKVQDFTDATKIVTDGETAGGSIRDKLIKLYENRGILPAEVAADAAKDPVLKEQLADPQAPLPAKYGGAQTPHEEVTAKVSAIEGAMPAPSILDDIYQKLRAVGVGEEVAQHQAAIPAAMFEAWGRRLGIDPMQLYRREGFDVRRDLPGVSEIGKLAPEEAQRIFEQRRGQPDMLSPEYQAAVERHNAASAEFRQAQEDYRARRIGDQDFLAARAKFDEATKEFDAAFATEQARPKAPRGTLAEQREAMGQMQMPGFERAGQGEMAQRGADEALKPTVEQKPMDIGLFSDEAKKKSFFQAAQTPYRSLQELRDTWTERGVRNFIADRPQRNQLQLSDVVVPEGDRGQGVGSAFMRDLIAFADANGRTVTLTPDASMGATSVARLKQFYKRFGFVENRGRNIDYEISDSMYRLPGTRTFDQAPAFYSAVERGIESARQDRASPEQWLGMLKNMPGVKAEELQWLGLEDWLKEQKGPVSKEAMGEYLRANRVEVREVEKGQFGPRPTTKQSDAILDWAEASNREDLRAAQTIIGDFEEGRASGRQTAESLEGLGVPDNLLEPFRDYAGGESGTKFGPGSGMGAPLPGGENYRELLLTLPEREGGERGPRGWGDTAGGTRDTANFRSPHWDEPNVLAHIRFDDRVVEGKKTLHIAEVQSDWHQKGRREGYQTPVPAELQREAENIVADRLQPNARWMPVNIMRGGRIEMDNIALRDIDHWQKTDVLTRAQADTLRQWLDARSREVGTLSVPDAPFKTSWPELALKRMIRYAAEHGYEKISWDTGATNAERYDLSKRISRVAYVNDVLSAWDHGGHQVIHRSDVKREQLPDYIGKEAADKLLATEPRKPPLLADVEKRNLSVEQTEHQYVVRNKDGREVAIGKGTVGSEDEALDYAVRYLNNRANEINLNRVNEYGRIGPTHELSGLDLKVGGEGMKGFYDKILPAAANKLAKRFGGKVEEATVERPPQYAGHWFIDVRRDPETGRSQYAVVHTEGETQDIFSTVAEATRERDRLNAGVGKQYRTEVHSLPITPELRQAALEQGFPLFQAGPSSPRGRITLGQNKTVIDLFATADRSTFLHETGHMWLDQLVRFAREVPEGHEIRGDLATVMDWLGVRDPAEIGVAQHERFARGFEQYLREGEAPSSRLAAAFEKFKQWLAAIYRQLTALGEPLSADVRGVMRRALASPAEIYMWTQHQEALAKGTFMTQVPSEITAKPPGEAVGAPEPVALGAGEAVSRETLPAPTPAAAEPIPQPPGGASAGAEAGVVSRETASATPIMVRPRQMWGPASRPEETWSLLEYLTNRGGLKPSPDLAVLVGRGQKPVPGFGMLVRRAGMSMDEALQVAKDGGFLHDEAEAAGRPQEVGHNDLYQLIDKELRGQKQYKLGYEPIKDMDPAEIEARISEHLDGELEAAKIDPRSVDAPLRARIFEIMTKERVSDPLVAYEQAVMEEVARGTETGQVERIPDHIPGWDVAHEPGTMEPAGGFARRLAAAAEPEARGAGAEFGEAGGGAGARGAGGADLRGGAGGAIGGRRAAEPGLRDPLGTPASFDQAGLPPDPNPKPYFTYDERGTARKIFDRIIRGWQNTFQPELISDAARTLDPIIAAYKSRQAMGHDQVWTLMEEDHQYWRRQTAEQRAEYLDSVEMADAKMPAEWQAQATSHRELLNLAYTLEKRAGSKAAYVEDYVPHLFEDPEQFRNFVKMRVNTLGPTWFQKPRAFEFIEEAKAAGLRLRTDNPADLIAHRLIASVDMIERMRLLDEMQKLGMAVPTKQIRVGIPNPEGTLFEMPSETVHYISPQDAPGWQEIVAPNREKWMIAPDAQALWKNGVEARGLWANEGAIGSAFRGWMAFKNVWVPIKLALSLFHPLHVLHIQQTEYLALAWNALVKGGDPIEALRNVGGAVLTYPGAIYSSVAAPLRGIGVPLPRVGMSAEGFSLREAWLVPEAERTPWQQAQVSLMNDGGFVPQLSEQLKIAAKRGLEDAVDNNKPVKLAFMGAKRILEVMQAPIFERWIPSLKASAYLRETTALLQRRPELLENDVLRQAAFRTIAKSIDNRFGEMFYGTLFWNRYVKDTGIGAFLSLGWNLGFAREFLGAAIEPGARLIERGVKGPPSDVAKIQRDASSKVPFVMGYVGSAALTMGLMTYLFTGETPSGYDFFLPRIGGTNPDGSPRRITNMTYLREIPMLLKHIEEHGGNVLAGSADMLWNKLIVQPLVELAKNASYYGYEIYDSSAPFWKQGYQAAKHVLGEQFDPMSAAGYRRAIQNGWSPWEASLSYLGFGPAPAYAERTATQNRIYYLYRRFVSPEVKPYELGETGKERQEIRASIVRARDSGDHPALEAAAQKWFKAGGSRQGLNNIMLNTPGDISLFKALPEPAQRAVLDHASPDEKTRYLPFYHHNTARKVADLTVAGEQARISGNPGAAAQAEAQITDLVREAVTNGWITDRNAFRRAVAQEVVARRLPEVSAILSLPKARRGQAAPRLLGPFGGAQPQHP